jgi:hypothetical protein
MAIDLRRIWRLRLLVTLELTLLNSPSATTSGKDRRAVFEKKTPSCGQDGVC